MRQFFRRLAHKTGLLHAPSDPARSATRPLRVLLVGAIVLPITLYAVAAAISYHQHFDEARDRLRRNLAIVHEHAQKVFETFEFASRYLDEITGNVTDEQIRANEAMYSERLRAMTASLPQLRDLWIVGADGHPLVSGTVYPMPQIDLSDRNYFKVHHDNPVNGPYVSRGAGRARRQHPFLRDQPQARDQRPVRRRHHRFDRAGIFQRILFPASAARHRDAAARRRRGAGPLSGLSRRADAAAGPTRRS